MSQGPKRLLEPQRGVISVGGVPVELAKGDIVAILESMKMEHEIRARTDGVVSAVSTAEGAQVAPNALLLTIAAA